MLYLAFIFHMHQPYYKNLLTGTAELPWVRLHGVKDYLDMAQKLSHFPAIHQTFNIVPSLMEQVEGYADRSLKDTYLDVSYKPASTLDYQDKAFILNNFFSINKDRVIATHPRYYELFFKKQRNSPFDTQDFLDLQVWFNLAWIDPSFRVKYPALKDLVAKGRYFSEEDKQVVLEKHAEILKDIIPEYKRISESGQLELSVAPYYHPILPLLYNTNVAKEANPRTTLPRVRFEHPEDAQSQIDQAVDYFAGRFGAKPNGMWPSEEAVSEHILPFIIKAGIKWIVTDEAILFKSLKRKKRDTTLLYQPHLIEREEGALNIIFRDRNLSDLIGFTYYKMPAKEAVDDFMNHLNNIETAFKGQDILVTIAMDGENAWEYYVNDGHDFLDLLYQRLSEGQNIKTTTVSEYLFKFPAKFKIKRLAAGSWIYGEFGKWIGNPQKRKAWEYLAKARTELNDYRGEKIELARKQMYVCEGSDWFWWYGEDPDGSFDVLFRMHLTNFYIIIGKEPPDYLNNPI
ncbi:MAG: glycoside hydrolase family 57 protein [Candidatus Omnitrophica bacterium]|nr:glycoside hydrolase family 57 protein [Candidatus Omnitrophota bacterium]